MNLSDIKNGMTIQVGSSFYVRIKNYFVPLDLKNRIKVENVDLEKVEAVFKVNGEKQRKE